ncbi:MAG: hypothetical protein QOE63_973, partial [Acidimicrobiaceae bacterium]
VGLFSGASAYNQKQQIVYATREGARYAATVPKDQTFGTGTWATNVRDLAVARALGDLTDAQVCVSLVTGSPGTVVTPAANFSTKSDGSACIAGQTYPVVPLLDTGLRVQVTASKPGVLDIGPFPGFTFTIDTQGTAKSESG